MRGTVWKTATLVLLAIGTASSSYLTLEKVREGRSDVCEVKSDSFELDGVPAAMIHRAQNSMKKRNKKGAAER